MKKIQLLIAVSDMDYSEHLSRVLMEKYEELFEISVCSSAERLRGLTEKHYDAALIDAQLMQSMPARAATLPLLLHNEMEELPASAQGMKFIEKYQRISLIVSQLLEQYADAVPGSSMFGGSKGTVTVVWSPAGGCGKTTTALALAAQRVAEGRKTAYLNLESFSSTAAYFPQTGKSISTVFGKLDSNVEALLQSIRQQDSGSGIYYFCQPENYDDINVLSPEDVVLLATNCARIVDELVIDLSSSCDEKTKRLLTLADAVLLVQDATQTAHVKLSQFCTQNSIFKEIFPKTVVVANRGSKIEGVKAPVVSLPVVQSENAAVVFKTLSAGYFEKYGV